jgi:23S rRNA (guanine745-N1)-methyltransferase
VGSRPVAVDLGCGSGETLARLAAARPMCAVGIDISAAAASHAARIDHADLITWVVANADRRLPLADGSASLVLSIHGRRNPAECSRVLANDGRLLASVPAPDDLIELREYVLGAPVEHDRVADMIRTHERWFRVIDRHRVEERRTLDSASLVLLLRGTYRGRRASQSVRVASLDRLEVTLASDIVLFEKRNQLATHN